MKTNEQYENYPGELSDSAICSSCGGFKVQPENIWFDNKGYGYSTKFTRCPHCGQIIILKYFEDYGFNHLNSDSRYYL